jgi:hypothetical protein
VPLSAAEVQAEEVAVSEPANVVEETPDTLDVAPETAPETAPAAEVEETHGDGMLP